MIVIQIFAVQTNKGGDMRTSAISNRAWAIISTVVIAKLWVVGASMVGTMALILSRNYGMI